MPFSLLLIALFSLSALGQNISIDKSCYQKGPISVPTPMPRLNRDCNCTNHPTESLQAIAEVAGAGTVEQNAICDMDDPNMKRNCIAFLNDPCVPEDSLKWALGVYKNNLGGLKMNKCLEKPLLNPPNHYSNLNNSGQVNMTPDKLEGLGIQNKCQILINDTRVSWPGERSAMRRTYFYLDLCTGVKRIGYFNLGSGSVNRAKNGKLNFDDSSGAHTTVLGAFLTSNDAFELQNNDRKYRDLKEQLRSKFGQQNRLPAVQLFGLQNSNNGAAGDFKYLHVSPLFSSWGCPSVAGEDYVMIDQLAKDGPSLVVNYGPNMEDPKECSQSAATP